MRDGTRFSDEWSNSNRIEQNSAARLPSTHLGQDLTPSSDRRAAAGFRSTVIAAGAAAPELEAIEAAEEKLPFTADSARFSFPYSSIVYY